MTLQHVAFRVLPSQALKNRLALPFGKWTARPDDLHVAVARRIDQRVNLGLGRTRRDAQCEGAGDNNLKGRNPIQPTYPEHQRRPGKTGLSRRPTNRAPLCAPKLVTARAIM